MGGFKWVEIGGVRGLLLVEPEQHFFLFTAGKQQFCFCVLQGDILPTAVKLSIIVRRDRLVTLSNDSNTVETHRL